MRLDKFLSSASVGTRKTVRNYVKEGKVTINNQLIMDPTTEVEEAMDVIRYLGKEVVLTRKIYYMLNKPAGCITARKDVKCKTVLDYIDVDNTDAIFPIGRLDKDTEGLLLLTNDGDFNHRLMHPDKHVEKTYFFWAFGFLDSKDRECLKEGISIGDDKGLAKAVKIEVEVEGTYQELHEKHNIEISKGISINPYHQPVVSGYITISEGRKHQVKRMLKAVGCYVIYLKRISIGGLMLDEMLNKGQYRELTEEEIRTI